MSFKTLAAAALIGVAATTGASAATIYATGYNDVFNPSPAAGRDDPGAALGAPDADPNAEGGFYEIGSGGSIDFTFGQLFTGPAALIEITFGKRSSWDEDTIVSGIRNGVATELARFRNDDVVGGAISVVFRGVFDELRFADNSAAGPDRGRPVNGIDIDSVAVSPVPVPAAGLLLAGALGALGLARRRAA